MKMKVSDLDGRALNWAVAFAEWSEPSAVVNGETFWWDHKDGSLSHFVKSKGHADSSEYQPSKNWAHGGPLIPKYEVHLSPDVDGYIASIHAVFEDHPDIDVSMTGGDPLEAACLCIVKYLNRCNDEIEIPDELCEVKS